MIVIEEGCANFYADLAVPDAQAMYVKARLASKIGDIIRHRHLKQQQAAEVLSISPPKLSGLLRRQFRSLSEAKMIE